MRAIALLVTVVGGLVFQAAAPTPTPSCGPVCLPSSSPTPAPTGTAQATATATPVPGTAWNTPLPPYTDPARCDWPKRAPNRRPPRTTVRAAIAAGGLTSVGPSYRCGLLKAASRLDLDLVRVDLVWADAEPEQGVYRWDRYDDLFAAAAKWGLRLLPVIDRTPSWAGPVPSALPPPKPYAAFVAAAVQRYGPHGRFWRSHPDLKPWAPRWFEIWNEPYYGPYAGLHPDPAQYAQLVKAAVESGRTVDASAHYLVAAEQNFWDPDRHVAVDWMNGMYDAVPHFERYVDAFGAHPYSSRDPAYRGSEVPLRGQTRRITLLHRIAKRRGHRDTPFWITELGWPTCTNGDGSCTTADTQARRVKGIFRLARRTWRFIDTVVIYQVADGKASGANTEASYGVFTFDGTPKPAAYVLHDLAARR